MYINIIGIINFIHYFQTVLTSNTVYCTNNATTVIFMLVHFINASCIRMSAYMEWRGTCRMVEPVWRYVMILLYLKRLYGNIQAYPSARDKRVWRMLLGRYRLNSVDDLPTVKHDSTRCYPPIQKWCIFVSTNTYVRVYASQNRVT